VSNHVVFFYAVGDYAGGRWKPEI